MAYAPPPGQPPTRGHDHDNHLASDGIPDEPPPAYSPAAGPQGDAPFQGGVSTSGGMEQNITGVGVGYGRRPHTSAVSHHDVQQGWNGGHIGSSGLPPASTNTNTSRPHPSTSTKASSSPSGSSRPPPPNDLTPTESPTPGRPLLNHGMMLVYPKAYFCSMCACVITWKVSLLLIRDTSRR